MISSTIYSGITAVKRHIISDTRRVAFPCKMYWQVIVPYYNRLRIKFRYKICSAIKIMKQLVFFDLNIYYQ